MADLMRQTGTRQSVRPGGYMTAAVLDGREPSPQREGWAACRSMRRRQVRSCGDR